MLAVPIVNSWGFVYSNGGTNPSATPGTSVTPGASNAEGSWTQVASSSNITTDICAFAIRIADGSATGLQKDHLVDIGVDPAGGTSYTEIVSNIVCGYTALTSRGGHHFYFPMCIPSGSSVAVRVQGSNATAGTVRAWMKFYGKPSRPDVIAVGAVSETIGTITNSQGVAFTPGSATEGAWTSLGTTTRALWYWNLGVQLSNATITSGESTWCDLAVGDGSNKHVIISDMLFNWPDNLEAKLQMSAFHLLEGYWHVPAGSTMYIRGHSDGAPQTTYNGVAIGVG